MSGPEQSMDDRVKATNLWADKYNTARGPAERVVRLAEFYIAVLRLNATVASVVRQDMMSGMASMLLTTPPEYFPVAVSAYTALGSQANPSFDQSGIMAPFASGPQTLGALAVVESNYPVDRLLGDPNWKKLLDGATPEQRGARAQAVVDGVVGAFLRDYYKTRFPQASAEFMSLEDTDTVLQLQVEAAREVHPQVPILPGPGGRVRREPLFLAAVTSHHVRALREGLTTAQLSLLEAEAEIAGTSVPDVGMPPDPDKVAAEYARLARDEGRLAAASIAEPITLVDGGPQTGRVGEQEP